MKHPFSCLNSSRENRSWWLTGSHLRSHGPCHRLHRLQEVEGVGVPSPLVQPSLVSASRVLIYDLLIYISIKYTYWWVPKKSCCKKAIVTTCRRIFELHLPRWIIGTVSLTAICKIPRLLDGCGIWGRWSSRFAATKVTWFIWFGPQGTQVNWVYLEFCCFASYVQLRPIL